MESSKRVKTGYFGSTSNDLIEFINSYKAEDLVENNLHIELLMYEFYEKEYKFLHNFYFTLEKLFIRNL